MSVVRTRFAPSPTGRLHLGHALAARVAHDLARQEPGGVFLLRFEDIDGPRVREEFYRGIEEDLLWLGLQWDETPLRQSTRTAAYEAALTRLREEGLVYPCFCTRKDIQEEWARMASAPQGPAGPVYPGTCRPLTPAQSEEKRRDTGKIPVPRDELNTGRIPVPRDALTAAEREEKLAAGAAHAWRLDSRRAADLTGPLTFHDMRHGTIPVDPELCGDVVLARKDIGCAYHLAVVVDDAFQQITHVTRGEDLLPATHVHRLLQVLLGLPEPVYLHHELVLDAQGKRLAKRNDALAIATLRENECRIVNSEF